MGTIFYVDPDYVAWQRLYHPSSLPEELSSAEGATSSVKSSRLEEEMELSSLSQKSPIQSTPIRGQDEPPDVSESPAQDSPVEQQNMTPRNSTTRNGRAKSSEVSSGSPFTSPSDSSTHSRRRSSEFLTPPAVASKRAKGKGKKNTWWSLCVDK